MIQLTEQNIRTLNRKSSKGNQMKFEQNGIWYKTDYLGYEGLCEYMVSHLLALSSLKPEEYVLYDPEQISYRGTVFSGCKSRDFTGSWQLITLERLFEQYFGRGMNQIVYSISDHTERLRTMVSLIERITGLTFGPYIAKMLTIDTFFLNEDRHAHNLALMTDSQGHFRLCPIFDNGAALLSDTTLDYPLHMDALDLIPQVKPKTFCESFDEQLDIAESLFGYQLHFSFGYSDIKSLLDQADFYSQSVRSRVTDLLMHQRRKYTYLFR